MDSLNSKWNSEVRILLNNVNIINIRIPKILRSKNFESIPLRLFLKIDNKDLTKCVLNKASSETHSSPGHALHPQVQTSIGESINSGVNGEQASTEQAQNQFMIPGGPIVSFPQMGRLHFLPSQTDATPGNHGVEFGNHPNISSSQLEVQRKFLQYQIEILQNQLQLLQRTKVDKSVDEGTLPPSSDSRGKQVASSLSASDHGYHEVQDEKS